MHIILRFVLINTYNQVNLYSTFVVCIRKNCIHARSSANQMVKPNISVFKFFFFENIYKKKKKSTFMYKSLNL